MFILILSDNIRLICCSRMRYISLNLSIVIFFPSAIPEVQQQHAVSQLVEVNP